MRLSDVRIACGMMGIMSLVAAGCATPPPAENTHTHREHVRINEGTSPAVRVETVGTNERLNQVGFTTNGLQRRVEVQQTGASRTPTNTLEVWARLRNRTDYTQRIQLRTLFLRADQSPLEDQQAWQELHLQPNTFGTYRTKSTRTDAAYYYIEIQEMP